MSLLFRNPVSATTAANIKEINGLDQPLEFLENYKSKKPLLIILDLDETVFKLLNMISSSLWKKTYRTALTKIIGLQKATEETNKIFAYARSNASVKLIEGEKTIQFINKAHKDHHVIFVTARPIIPGDTERQLKDCNIEFNVSNKFKQNVLPDQFARSALAQNGIIYTQDGDKGECLEKYLETIGCDINDFDGMLCLDDRKNKVEQLANAATRLKIPFYGFRYGFLDQELAEAEKINPEEVLKIGKLQLDMHLEDPSKPFIPDEEARSILGINKRHALSKL